MVPLKNPTSPDSITFVSLVRSLAMKFALKKVAVTLLRPVPSVMRSTFLRPVFIENVDGVGDDVDEW